MEITLKNYKTVLPKDLLALAGKNKVRECDETDKGHFVAYVDEGKDTFDVALNFSSAGDIELNTCDCRNGDTFCRHKTALLLHIAEGRKTKAAVKTKKKAAKAELLLDEVQLVDLKEWVRGVIQKNKDFELSFVHYFSGKQVEYIPADVEKLTGDAIKVVAGNKKNVDVSQLKKLVELWREMLGPVIDGYHANVSNEKSFFNFHTHIECCLKFQMKINVSSNKVTNYIVDNLKLSVAYINNLAIEEAWDTAVKFYMDNLIVPPNEIRVHYLYHLNDIVSGSADGRKQKLTRWLAEQYDRVNASRYAGGQLYTKVVLGLVEDTGLFPVYYKIFSPIVYDNDFNLKLVKLLIHIGQFDKAVAYSEDQIRLNVKDEFSISYWLLLKEVYTLQKNDVRLAEVLGVLFPFTFNFDDYLFIAERMPEDERKKWRTKILTKARNAFHSRSSVQVDFCFKLMGHEKNYRKMIDYVGADTNYQNISRYFEAMLLADKHYLMDELIRKSDHVFWQSDGPPINNEPLFSHMCALAEKHYSKPYLKSVLNKIKSDRWRSRLNNFFMYLDQQLKD